MLTAFLHSTFRRFAGGFDQLSSADGPSATCAGTLEQAVEQVVDALSPRLRAVPGYARRLREPVATALRSVDQLVDRMTEVRPCHRAAYASDPQVNAFFVNYADVQALFSESAEVRGLFDADPDATQCFALLCMYREERRQLGMAMDGELLRRDVLQTWVNFTDHQLVSPGRDEADARCALKCCIFSNLLSQMRLDSADAQTRATELERRAQAWQARLRRATPGSPTRQALQAEIDAIDAQRRAPRLRHKTLDERFAEVIETLSHPQRLVSARDCNLFIDPLGLRCDGPDSAGARELSLMEIEVVGRSPRVACLVNFPRAELLPERDFLHEASLFLAA